GRVRVVLGGGADLLPRGRARRRRPGPRVAAARDGRGGRARSRLRGASAAAGTARGAPRSPLTPSVCAPGTQGNLTSIRPGRRRNPRSRRRGVGAGVRAEREIGRRSVIKLLVAGGVTAAAVSTGVVPPGPVVAWAGRAARPEPDGVTALGRVYLRRHPA